MLLSRGAGCSEEEDVFAAMAAKEEAEGTNSGEEAVMVPDGGLGYGLGKVWSEKSNVNRRYYVDVKY